MSLVKRSLFLFFFVWPWLIGCTASVTDGETEEIAQGSENVSVIECEGSESECFCELPDGRKLLHGSTIEMYKTSKSSCGLTCAQQMKPAICMNGKLVVESGYNFQKCEEVECQACQLPWGEQLSEGAEIEVYKADKVGCTSSCQKSTVRCTNNQLVGANLSTYPYPNCILQECKECLTPWGVKVPDGQSIVGYTTETVNCGTKCSSKSLKCEAGQFSSVDIALYKFGTCKAETCLECETPWGLKIPNNRQVTAFKSSRVACGQSCLDNNNALGRMCVDGVLTGDSAYRYGSCSPDICEEGGGAPGFVCRLPWDGSNALAGTIITAYSKQNVGCDDNCDKYRVTRKCRIEDGLFDGAPEAIYPNCTRNCK
jgi:hypothetical protein